MDLGKAENIKDKHDKQKRLIIPIKMLHNILNDTWRKVMLHFKCYLCKKKIPNNHYHLSYLKPYEE